MPLYESIYILRPDLTDEQADQSVSEISEAFGRMDLEVLRVEPWGKKRLAYTVKKQKYGFYTLVYFRGESAQIKGLERFFKLNDQVIKSLVVRVEKERVVLDMLAAQKSSPAAVTEGEETAPAGDAEAPAAATALGDVEEGEKAAEKSEEDA